MTTARDIIKAALTKIGVVGVGQETGSDEADEALFTLNAMMHGWKARSADIEFTDMTLDDQFPIGDEFVLGTVYLLAANLSPDYTVPANFDADDWFRTLQAAYVDLPTLTVDAALLRPPSREDRDGNLPLTTT